MENIENNTTNLSGNLGGINPPVFVGATEQKVDENILEVKVEESSVKEPIVIEGDIVIPTALLRKIVAQARKVGVANNLNPLSEILNLIIDENGITVRTTSGVGKQDFECIDRTYVFKNKLSIALDICQLGDYLNIERNNMLTLQYVAEENALCINTGSGVRKFPQRMDATTYQPVENKLTYSLNYNDMIAVNYEKLNEILDITKSARDLASKGPCSYLKGVHFGEDILVASDGNIMIIQANQTEFNNKIFFMDNDLCNLINNIEFEPSKFRVGFVDENGFPKAIILSDGRITICGPIRIEKDFPFDVAQTFWKSEGFTNKVIINTKEFYYILKSVAPFVPKFGANEDKIVLDINGVNMKVKCLDGTAQETFAIENPNNFVTPKSIPLPLSKLEKLVQTITTDKFEICIDLNSDSCVSLNYEGLKSIVTTLNDE